MWICIIERERDYNIRHVVVFFFSLSPRRPADEDHGMRNGRTRRARSRVIGKFFFFRHMYRYIYTRARAIWQEDTEVCICVCVCKMRCDCSLVARRGEPARRLVRILE